MKKNIFESFEHDPTPSATSQRESISKPSGRFSAGLTIVLRICEIGTLIALALFLLELRQVAKGVEAETAALQKVTVDADAAVLDIQGQVTGVRQNLNAVLIQLGLTADEARRASIEQRTYWKQIGAESVIAVRHADGLIVAATDTINRTGDDLHGVTTGVQFDLQTLDKVLLDLEAVAANADRNLANNPDLPRALKSAADGMEQINRTTANLEQTSADVRDRVHALTHPKPQKWFIAVGEKLLDLAYKVKAFI